MNKIPQTVCAEFETKGSRFLSFLVPFKEFEKTLKDLKASHSKAVHFVYAYRFFESGRIQERFSDDGEPKGSSGIPVLNVLRGENLLDTAVIVVRYFGGVLLGVGGLVRAYTKSVLLCVQEAKKDKLFIPFELSKSLYLQCPYALFSKLEYLAKQLNLEIRKQDFLSEYITIEIFGNSENIDIFLNTYEHQLKFRS